MSRTGVVMCLSSVPLFYLVALSLLVGCPGEIRNRECLPPEPIPECFDEDFVATEYLASSCGTASCHEAGGNNIDLESEGVFERLLAASPSATACAHVPMIDPANWESSYLMLKLRDRQGPSCGLSMPNLGAGLLPNPEYQCLGQWITLGGSNTLSSPTPGCGNGSGLRLQDGGLETSP